MPAPLTQLLWNDFCRFLGTGGGDDANAGLAAIEFALIAPLLAIGIIGTADLGMGIYLKMQVQAAAQAGAEHAATHGFDATAISNAIRTATSLSTIEAEPAPVQFCGCPTASGVNAVACGASCDGGVVAGTYVSSAAQSSYTTIIPYPSFPAQFDLTAQATVRVR